MWRTSPTPTANPQVGRQLATGAALIARGLGRSYGDAAQLSGGLVLSNLGLDGMGAINEHGVVQLGAGVSIDQLLQVWCPRAGSCR